MTEEWRDIAGFEGRYRISSLGRVESLQRHVQGRLFAGRIMVLHTHMRGYWIVWLRKGKGVHQKHFVHRLVACAFIPNPENKPIVNHIDGDRKNPKLSNLEWVDQGENVRHGIARRGGNLASLIPF